MSKAKMVAKERDVLLKCEPNSNRLAPASLLNLPTELLLLLPFNFDEAADRISLLSLTMVCRRFHEVFRPVFYSNIHLGHKCHHPASCIHTTGPQKLFRVLGADGTLRNVVEHLSIDPWTSADNTEVSSEILRSLPLKSVTILDRSFLSKDHMYLQHSVIISLLSNPHLRSLVMTCDLSVDDGREEVWARNLRSQSLSELTVASDIMRYKLYCTILSATTNLKKLTFMPPYQAYRHRCHVCEWYQAPDNRSSETFFFTSILDAYQNLEELCLSDPLMPDIILPQTILNLGRPCGPLLRTALQTTNKLKRLTLWPETLLPFNDACSMRNVYLSPYFDLHILPCLPRSLEHLTMLIDRRGYVPEHTGRGWLVDLLSSFWRYSTHFAKLELITVKAATDVPMCHSCFWQPDFVRQVVWRDHQDYYEMGVPYELIPALHVRKLISGTKYYLNAELCFEIPGILLSKPPTRFELRTLREQDYWKLPRDVEGEMCKAELVVDAEMF